MSNDLRISEAAAIVGVHENTIRNAIKRFERSDGESGLRAKLRQGQYGREYAIHPKVFAAWVLERYGRQLDEEELAGRGEEEPLPGTNEPDPALADLYERLIEAEASAARYLAIEAASTDIKQLYERQIDDLRERLAIAEARLEAERARPAGLWQRLFGRPSSDDGQAPT
jgi:hypothetical protein